MDRPVIDGRRLVKFLALLAMAAAALGGAHVPARVKARRSGVDRAPVSRLAQAGNSDDETSISSAQVDQYVAVYAAMQRDHSLTVEQAASRQGLTMPAFRELENKIERSPVIHDRVLKALRAAAKAGSEGGSGPARPR